MWCWDMGIWFRPKQCSPTWHASSATGGIRKARQFATTLIPKPIASHEGCNSSNTQQPAPAQQVPDGLGHDCFELGYSFISHTHMFLHMHMIKHTHTHTYIYIYTHAETYACMQ